ncbi:MAG TPA: efflux RND transporter periplasmic adaptor subunit [Thermoanaerobaculia bacterium]|nr:efflux RND transporter periplasmic adaptor subunit [Thermoanaerobaculia bacterium]
MADPKASLSDLRIDDDDRLDLSRSRRRKKAVLLVVLLGGLVTSFVVMQGGKVYSLETLKADEIRAEGPAAILQASGYVTARRKATVSSKFTGKVTEILVEEGMKVEEGQVLARLDDSLLSREVGLAEARLQAARSSLTEIEVRLAEAELSQRRSAQLVASGVTAQSQLDADRAGVDSLKARLAAAKDEVAVAAQSLELSRQLLTDAVIRAPFAGVAVSKDAQPGEMISPVSAGGGFTRTGICTLVDMSSLEIEVDVNEAYINRVVSGQRVEAVLDSYPDWKIPGRVITTVPTADRQKATVTVRIGFDQLDPRILPDMGAKVSFLDDSAAAAGPRRFVLVPCGALVKEGEQRFAFVLDAEGKTVSRRAVTVAQRPLSQDCEVTEGIAGGELVATDPPAELKDGDRARPARKKS